MIKTDLLSQKLRERAIRPDTGQILISKIAGSEQEADLSEPPNCQGYGRVRHFRYATPAPWPSNPLPIAPAAERLGLPLEIMGNAQVFQNAACNWRCWYCFVPFNLLAANETHAAWLTADELVGMYMAEPDPPLIIDCSGGQPDLTPEWIPWMMEALVRAGISQRVYLWSDDNLSNDYFWQYLTNSQLETVSTYRNYGRVCCFKGFDPVSFSFNTKASPDLFQRQFDLMGRLLQTGMDIYCYATFTSPVSVDIRASMVDFIDRLMVLHPNLPLRLVPLRIENFGVVEPRVGSEHLAALAIQEEAVQAWNELLYERFTNNEIETPMPRVDLTR